MIAGAIEPNAVGRARSPNAMMMAISVPCTRPPPGNSANAQKKPMPTMIPGIACGIRARYSTLLEKRNGERLATRTASSARTLTSTAPTADDDEAVGDRLHVDGECEDPLVVAQREALNGFWSGVKIMVNERKNRPKMGSSAPKIT